MNPKVRIVADHREAASRIPGLLEEYGAEVVRKQLKTGDYILNDEIVVERKSRDDFIISIIQGRLFTQCAALKRADRHSVLLIEGNPYQTKHNIDRKAIQGALLSVSVCWQAKMN
ncbi:MAG: hypothetical protein JXB34_11590 [Bacteroidales bacterium]|nr:hypothetical protein [Bacteroidales bacterium]